MNTTHNIEERIRSAIDSIPSYSFKGITNGARTTLVFEKLLELGSDPELNIADFCVSNKQLKEKLKCSGGCMYDLLWYDNHPDGQFKGILKSIPLILECEWGSSVTYDFEKLLMGKAKYKVMVFQASGKHMLDHFERMKSGIEAFGGGSVGETYLLACFDSTRNAFEIRTIKN
jgi:hypothetical protein